MFVESAADRAGMFDPAEFGEPVVVRRMGVMSAPPPIATVAIHSRPSRIEGFANTEVLSDTHRFTLQRAAVPAPRAGDTITITATGERFDVVREPEASIDGALWTLTAAPAP